MPYQVANGEVHDGGARYKCGDFVPGEKGSLADMEAVGAVRWVETAAREKAAPAPAPPAAVKKPAAKKKT